MEKIVVVGYKGKMGSVVFETLKAHGFNVFGKDKEDDFDCFCDVNGNNLSLCIFFVYLQFHI